MSRKNVVSKFSIRAVIFILVYTISVSGQNYQLSSSCGGGVQAGGNCTLACNTGTSQSGVAWTDYGSLYIHQSSNCSSTSPSLPTDYTSACPSSTNYTITFTNASYSRDSKTWSCRSAFGGSNSNNLTIEVQVGPEQVAITLPPNTPAIENRDLTLTCTVTAHPAPTFTWDYSDGTSTGGSTGPVTLVSGSTSRWSQTLTFRLNRNKLTVRCRTINTQTSATQDATTTLDVKYPPSKPTVTVNPVVCEGQPVFLGCSSSDPGNPAATYTWTKNNNSVSSGFSSVRTDNGTTIRCSAGNIFTDRPGYTVLKSDTKTIIVHYAPVITIQVLTTNPRKEGDSLSLTCVSDSNPDTSDSAIKWMFDGVETQGPGLQKSDVSRHDHGVYMCTATVNSGTCGTLQGHRNFTVIVNYAPNVTLTGATITEGQPFVLACQAEGRPATYTFRRFTQYWGDTEIQTGGGQQTADTYTLRIDTASYLDSGLYECGVDNTVTDRNGVLVQRKKVDVRVKAKPKFTRDSKLTYGAEVGSSLTLFTTFFSRENCTYNWTFSGQSSHTKNVKNLLVTRVTLDVYGKIIQDDGWNVTLTLTSFQERDIGSYTVVVCNSVGCNSSDISLTAAGPPLVPLDFLVINATETTIVLRWKPNFSGGDFTQMFILQYRKVGQSTWTTEEKEDDHQEFVYAKISELAQGTKYEFRVRAQNSRDNNNEGPFTDVITQQTLGVLPNPSSNQTGAIVGSVIGVLAVCVLIICAVILYRRGYRCVNKNADSPNISREPQENDNTAYASVDSTENLPGSTYDRLENTPSEEYTRLNHDENMKGQGTRTVDYENLKSKSEQLHYDSVELHTYENAVRKESSNPDPTYVNTPKP